VLLPLYAPDSALLVITPLGRELRALAPQVLSRHAVRRFLGYMDSQRQRLLGRVPAAAYRTGPNWSTGTGTTSSTPHTPCAWPTRAGKSPATPT
jgi:hypothetical protein